VAAINFSSGNTTSTWSTSKSEAERVLLAYQGGGTVAPVKRISETCRLAEAKVMVLMMTDADIANWDDFVGSVKELTNSGHKLFLFHIGSGSTKRKSRTQIALEDAGATVYPIKSAKDLLGLVIREVRSIYLS
jgi:hypothetical protein